MIDEENLILRIPDKKTIPCLTCKHGAVNFLAVYCTKYKLKPNSVYYESKECENYEPIESEQKTVDNESI